MVDQDLGEPGGYESRTAELLAEGEIEVLDIEGIPTVSLEDALAIVSAVRSDMGKGSVSWISDSLFPVDATVREAAIDPDRDTHKIDALQAVRIVGEAFADRLADLEGFDNEFEYRRAKYAEYDDEGNFTGIKAGKEDESLKYFGISDGTFYFALQKLGDRKKVDMDDVREGIPGLEDDEVLQAYFELMCEQFRVNLKFAFEVLDPTFMLAFSSSDKKIIKGVTVVNAMAAFLERKGYDRNFSRVAFIGAGGEETTEE
jgi:hypothetical protein